MVVSTFLPSWKAYVLSESPEQQSHLSFFSYSQHSPKILYCNVHEATASPKEIGHNQIFFSFFFFLFFLWRCGPTRAMASSIMRFLDHTQRRTTVGRTPLDEWSARRRDLYLTTHNTHNRQISVPPVGFEPMISAGERPQTYALDRGATGTGNTRLKNKINGNILFRSTVVGQITHISPKLESFV